MAETVGTIQVVASINTKDYDAGKKHIERGNQELETGAKKTSSGFSAAWMGAIAGVAAALTNKFVNAVTSSIDSAIKRVDTLNNSTRTFENMGISAEDSSKAMKALEKSIKGLPTPLDSAVRGMTALTATYGDIDKGQKVFSALNNAILGFGGTAAMVDNAITQLSQLPMDGPLDAQTWNSLRNSGITPVLTAMAKDSGMSVAAMKEAFGSGELTVQDFIDRLLKLDKEGGGGLKSLETIAKDSTAGISTGFANLQTAITRGVANIIQAIGSENISNAISAIGKAFEVTLKAVANAIGGVIDYIKRFSETETAIAIMERLSDAFGIVRDVISGLIGGIKNAPKTINNLWKGFKNLPNVIQLIVNPIGALINNFKEIWIIIKEMFLPSLEALWNTIKDQLAPIIGTLIDTVVRLYDALQPALVNILKWVGLIIGAVLVAAIWLFINVLNIVLKVIGFLLNIFLDLVGWLANIISWIGNVGGAFSDVWNWIADMWAAAPDFFRGVWNGIKNAFGSVANWFRNTFATAWQAVKNVFSSGGTIFNGIKDGILSVFKTVVNGIIRGMNTVIKVPFDGINNALARIRDISIVGQKPFGWLPTIGVPQIPMLAKGGIVSSPTIAMIGEGRESEAVIPLSKLDALLDNDRSNNSNNVTIETLVIEKDVDIDLVARKLGIKQLNTYRGIA